MRSSLRFMLTYGRWTRQIVLRVPEHITTPPGVQHSVYRQIDGWGFQTTLIGRDGYCTYITSERVTTTMWPTSTTAYPYHMKPYYFGNRSDHSFPESGHRQCHRHVDTTNWYCMLLSAFLLFSLLLLLLLLLLLVVLHVCNSMTSGVVSRQGRLYGVRESSVSGRFIFHPTSL